jgi:glycosyltransferase involved in cell wall biosynthesis
VTGRRPLAARTSALPDNFELLLPEPWLPVVYRPAWIREQLLAARLERGWRQLRRRGCHTLVLHLWHHQFESALQLGEHDLSLYHIDDEYSFEFEPPPMPAEERRVIERVDQVFVISPGLLERKGGINSHTALVPEGVDYELYSTEVPDPDDMAAIPHPRIGYTGALKLQLDWRLQLELARRHPSWSLVFVGPRRMPDGEGAILDEMARLPNVYFLGPKSVADLARYPQHFDVCTMPYLVNGYTNNIYPLKLHEYLASGRPVVGSPIRSLRDFSHLIGLATTVDEWSAALAAALDGGVRSGASVAARQAVAREHDWGVLVHQIAATICERLGGAHAASFHERAPDCVPLGLSRV